MRNRYPGKCYWCGKTVDKGEGHFEKIRPGKGWRTIHADCVFEQRKYKDKLREEGELNNV